MRQLTRRQFIHASVASVGLLATTGTIRSSVYRNECARLGLKLLVPEQSEQDRLDTAICDVKAGVNRSAAGETFESVGEELIAKGADAMTTMFWIAGLLSLGLLGYLLVALFKPEKLQ